MAKAAVAKKKPKRPRKPGPSFIQRSRSVSSEQKAVWHNVTGAGKSRVKRPFFEVGNDDQKAISDGIEQLIKARIDSAGTGAA